MPKSGGSFKKGVKPGPGRPKGAKSKKWATLEYWYERLEHTLNHPKMSLIQRSQIEFDMIVTILARKPLPPDSPEESLRRAEVLQADLKKLEDEARRGSKPGND